MKSNTLNKILLFFISLIAISFYAYYLNNTSFFYKGIKYFTLFDDTMIGMRFAKNLAAGHGFVYNIGEHIEGYTHFLWALYMYLIHLLPFHESKLPLILSLSNLLILFLHIYYNKKCISVMLDKYLPDSRIDNSLLWIYSIAFIGLYYGLLFWSLLGLEVGIICLAYTYILYIITNNKLSEKLLSIRLSIIFGVLFLIRMDTIIYSVAVCVYLFIINKRKISYFIFPITAVLTTIIGLTLFRYYYYQDLLPNTFYLKVAIETKDRLYYGSQFMLQTIKESMGLIIMIALISVIFLRGKIKEVYLGLFILFTSVLYTIYIGGDSWENNYFPNRHLTVGIATYIPLLFISLVYIGAKYKEKPTLYILLFIILVFCLYFLFYYKSGSSNLYFGRYGKSSLIIIAACIFMAIGIIIVNRFSKVYSIWISTLSLLVLCFLHLNLYSYVNVYWHKVSDIELTKAQSILGLYIRDNTKKDLKLAVVFGGALPYFCDRYCTDLMGKCERKIAKGPRRLETLFKSGHMKWDLIYSDSTYHPDVMLNIWNASDAEYEMLDKKYYKIGNSYVNKQLNDTSSYLFLREMPSGELYNNLPLNR